MPTNTQLENAYEGIVRALDRAGGEMSQQAKDNIERFLTDCNLAIDEGWKHPIMVDSRKRILDILNDGGEYPEEKPTKDEIEEMIRLHMRWVVPVPPDPEVVRATIERDRATVEKHNAD